MRMRGPLPSVMILASMGISSMQLDGLEVAVELVPTAKC
jgi:hypothetical protein